MHRLSTQFPSARLLAMSVLLALLPLAALGWLGRQMLTQERELESGRRQDRVENIANSLADRLARIATAADDTQLPPDVAWIVFDSQGVVAHRGAPLRYVPETAAPRDAPADVFAGVELIEFQQSNPALAQERYRELSRSPDHVIRAAAIARLAGALARHGKPEEALAAYDDLAALGATAVAGVAAELKARRERAELFDRLGDAPAATAERRALARLLAEGRYRLDWRTFDLYREQVPPLPASPNDLTRAVADQWPRWHTQPTGREAWTDGNLAYAAAWAPHPQGTVAVVGVSALDAVAEEETAAARRYLLISGFGLMTLVTVAAAYFIFRSLNRELHVARLQSDFVAQVSHEFRTPLAAMRHLTELLEDGSASTERLPQYYQALGKETRRLHSMVEGLLDFGRIESGRHVYTLEDLNMLDVAARVVNERASPRVHLNMAGGAPHVRADREALVLAVQNLLDNAIKYSPESSSIDVSVEARDGRVGISVEDRGAGMSPAEQRDIRRKFVRGSAARMMNVKGTGIGLAIVEQVARAHHGRLDVRSEPGRGSRFTLWVPALEQSA